MSTGHHIGLSRSTRARWLSVRYWLRAQTAYRRTYACFEFDNCRTSSASSTSECNAPSRALDTREQPADDHSVCAGVILRATDSAKSAENLEVPVPPRIRRSLTAVPLRIPPQTTRFVNNWAERSVRCNLYKGSWSDPIGFARCLHRDFTVKQAIRKYNFKQQCGWKVIGLFVQWPAADKTSAQEPDFGCRWVGRPSRTQRATIA